MKCSTNRSADLRIGALRLDGGNVPIRRSAFLAAGVLIFALLGFLLGACTPQREPLTIPQRAAIYERATVQFTNAVLFKPLETGPTNTLGFKLAPLLLQEITNTNAALATPVVFFDERSVLLNGKLRVQMVYVWHPPAAAKSTGDGSFAQGIRITLNESGSPVIWEVLADDSGGELIFVSQSLQAAAIEAFGPPLPGRRLSIESSLETAPDAIVPRVIEDGPVPMGPIVHLNSGSHNVSTLICRCMPTQAKNLLATETYELRPLAESELRQGFDQPGESADARLVRVLRLPAF